MGLRGDPAQTKPHQPTTEPATNPITTTQIASTTLVNNQVDDLSKPAAANGPRRRQTPRMRAKPHATRTTNSDVQAVPAKSKTPAAAPEIAFTPELTNPLEDASLPVDPRKKQRQQKQQRVRSKPQQQQPPTQKMSNQKDSMTAVQARRTHQQNPPGPKKGNGPSSLVATMPPSNPTHRWHLGSKTIQPRNGGKTKKKTRRDNQDKHHQ